jgi:prevent-host-death family protein
MSLARNIRTITEMKTKAARLLDQINSEKRPVVITQDGKPRAVMMDVESYEDLRNALGILKLAAQGEEDFRRGRWTRHDELFNQLERRLKHGRKRA